MEDFYLAIVHQSVNIYPSSVGRNLSLKYNLHQSVLFLTKYSTFFAPNIFIPIYMPILFHFQYSFIQISPVYEGLLHFEHLLNNK